MPDGLTFEWDPWKGAANHRKHGVSFGEAATVFRDSEAMEYFERLTGSQEA